MNRRNVIAAAGVAFAALLSAPSMLLAQTVGAAQSFAIVGGQSVTAAGTGTVVTGDVGVSPGVSITGFPANATIVPPYATHVNDAAAVNAQAATLALYNSLAALPPGTVIANELNAQILGPGTYSLGAANLAANGNLTLVGAGDYIFKVGSALTANVGSTVTLVGVDPCRVFWQVTSAATLNGVNFVGNVVAQAAVTLGTSARLAGRALTTSLGDVTLAGSNIIGGCSTAPAVPPPPAPGTDLILVKSHTGNFVVGTNGTFTIAVSNVGGAASVGQYTVVDTLPTGLTFVSAAGTNWTCSNVGQVVTCTNSTPIAAGASAASNILLTVTPGAGAVPSVVNNATIAGGGDTVLTNNTTVDVVIVSPALPPVPTMGEWAMIALMGLLMIAGYTALARRKKLARV